MVEWNENDLYPSIIPVGDCNWYNVFRSLALSPVLHDTAYKCFRYFDKFEHVTKEKNNSLPTFFPNEHIILDGGINYRIVVTYPLLKGKYDLVLTPWFDEEISYDKACIITMEKCIENHSNCTLIITKSYVNKEDKEMLDRVIKFCKGIDRKYIVVKDDCYVNYEKIYKYFKEGVEI